jgi:hypothetical protein
MQGVTGERQVSKRICGALFVRLTTLRAYFYTILGGTLCTALQSYHLSANILAGVAAQRQEPRSRKGGGDEPPSEMTRERKRAHPVRTSPARPARRDIR